MVQEKHIHRILQREVTFPLGGGYAVRPGRKSTGLIIVVILCFIVLSGICSAECSGICLAEPQPPHAFYGNVSIAGIGAPVNTTITARVDNGGGILLTDTLGRYGGPGALSPKLLVQGVIPDASEIGFFVNGMPAKCREYGTSIWESSYPYSSGKVTDLDLNVEEISLTANFSGNPTTGYEPLTVQFTDLSTGQHNQWSWVFGDGATSNLQNPNHTYTDGKYTVSLTVSNGTVSSYCDKYKYITVNAQSGGSGGGGGGGGVDTFIIGGQNTTQTLTPTPTATLPMSGGLTLGSDNTTTQQVTIAAADNIGSLIIGVGVAPVDASGQPLRRVFFNTLSAASLPPGSPCTSNPYSYEITPSGASFTPAITLVLSFNETTWAGLSDKNPSIIGYNPFTGVWEEKATETDSSTRTVKAMVTKGGIYSLCLNAGPETAPPTATTAPSETSGSPGLPMGIIIPVVLLIIVIVGGAILYLVISRRSNGGSPPEGGQ
jgi:PKD repeat protein